MDRRTFLAGSAATAMSALGTCRPAHGAAHPVRIGLVLPLSGPQAGLGHSLRQSARIALDDINQEARTRGHPSIVAFVEDGGSPRACRRSLSRLAAEARVVSIFGLVPDGMRTELNAFLATYKALFWDPAPTLGGECNGNIIHGGPTPYQSLKFLVPWMAGRVGNRFLIVGTDEPYPTELQRIGREMVKEAGAFPTGRSELFPTGHLDFTDTLTRARNERADVILSSLTGPSVTAFFRQYRAAGFDPRETPVASATLDERSAQAAGPHLVAGAIASAPYFADWNSVANRTFIQRLRQRTNGRFLPHSLAEAMWFQLHQFAAALAELDWRGLEPGTITAAAKGIEVEAPEGPVRIERESLYTFLWPKIAVAEPTGQFRVLARSDAPVPPLPFWGWPGKSCVNASVVER